MVVFGLLFGGAAYVLTQEDESDPTTTGTTDDEGLGSRLPGNLVPGTTPDNPGTTPGTPETTVPQGSTVPPTTSPPVTTEPSGPGSGSTDSPEGTLQAFATAMNARDCQAVIDLGTDQSFDQDGGRDEALADCEDTFSDSSFELTVTLENVETIDETSTTAVVQADVTFSATFDGSTDTQTTTDTVHMVLEGGEWLIDDWEEE